MTKLQQLGRAAAPIARELIGLSGLALVVAGIAMAAGSAIAMIVAGLMMVAAAAIWAIRS